MIQQHSDCPAPGPEPSVAGPAAPLDSPAISTPNADALPSMERLPGETPRAFGAFLTYFHLGHGRSLQGVADRLDEVLPTVKKWSSKYRWRERINDFNSGLLGSSAAAEAARQRRLAADWADRLRQFREQEWDAAQKLNGAARCFLDSFGEEELHKMNLAQVSRALKISSQIGRLALGGAELPAASDPELSPVQQQFLNAIQRLYRPDAAASASISAPESSVAANQNNN